MARPLRLEFAGALYHVTSRGDGQEDIYRCDEDRRAFLMVLAAACGRFNWLVHAYCLMTNHYHLLVETPDANLSRGMRQLNGVYTQRFNRSHQRVGHVFQGRYKAILVQKESYLLELARYVVLNPVRARMVKGAGDWPWSSYRATRGTAPTPEWLQTTWLLSAFADSEQEAVARYIRFVSEGQKQPSPWEQLRHQVFLGSEDFATQMQHRLPCKSDLTEIPRAQRRPLAQSLIHYEQQFPTRDASIAAAYASGGFTMKAIGEHFGLHYSRVSRIIQQQEEAKDKT